MKNSLLFPQTGSKIFTFKFSALKQCVFVLFCVCLPLMSKALPKEGEMGTTVMSPSWRIVVPESSITFTATQNNVPISGQLTKFSGEVYFSTDNHRYSHNFVSITVDMKSLTTSYEELSNTLKSKDWFDINQFPESTFIASEFKPKDDKHWEAVGKLTLRNKTLPITLNFIIDEYTETKLKLHGIAILKRNDFGVGQGDWSKTDSIKDEVTVSVQLSAVK